MLKREYSGFFAVIAIFTMLEVLGDYVVAHELQVDWLWVVIFSVGFGVYLILRTLKKHTRILHVDGR